MLLNLSFRYLVFPGRAGQLQKAGATAALAGELGTNYSTYHAFLAQQFASFGGRPVRDDFASIDEYLRAWAEIDEIVEAEQCLRYCKAVITGTRCPEGDRANPIKPAALPFPLVTQDDQLGAWTA